MYMYASTLKLNILKTKKDFVTKFFRESLYIHVLLAQQILALLLYRSKIAVKLSRGLRKKKRYTCNFLVL
jgi:hypothetical protein